MIRKSSILVFSLFLLILSSCKRDAGMASDQAIIEVDFLLNERDLQKFGLEYTEQEFERDTEDPNKVLTVRVGEPVKFKDTSEGSSSASSRRWQLNNEEEWEIAKEGKNKKVPEFEYTFDEPGYHRITLVINEFQKATKLIKVVESDYVTADDNIAIVDNEPAQNQQDDLFEETQSSSTPTTSSQPPAGSNTSRPSGSASTSASSPSTSTPPAPVKLSSVNFTMPSREVIVGESFELRDISSPSSAVTARQWDFGDGSTKRTSRATYRHMYFTAGQKTISLCVNGTDQCVTKTIVVNPKPEPRKEVVTSTPKPAEPKVEKKPEVASVEFKMADEAIVGDAVNLLDRSAPANAVNMRTWSFGDGTSDLTTARTSVEHVFKKAGTFEVKLCVNSSSKCTTQSITIKDKEVVVVTPPPAADSKPAASNDPYADYDGSQLGRVGLLSSQKCDDQSFEWHEGAAFINITPKQFMELDEAKVYANNNSTIDIILTSEDKKDSGVLKNVQLNPGSSVIYLTDLAIIMRPNQNYTLMIKPTNADSGLKLENSAKCKPNPLPSDVVSVSYNNKLILYDLKFYY